MHVLVADERAAVEADERLGERTGQRPHALAEPGGKHHGAPIGLGLGLYIVARLTQILGHPLTLASRPGRGTVFRLMLKPTDAHDAADRAATAATQLASMP